MAKAGWTQRVARAASVMISSYVAKTLCVARFAHAFLGPNGSAIARRAFVERAHQAEPLQLYYLDCGAGLSLLEAHLEKYRFLRGTEVPSADDLVAREKVEAAGHNLEKYPFPRVRDWIERLRQTDATTTASGEVAVEFLEHSPVNLDYIKQLRSQEEQEFKYHVYAKRVTESFDEDALPMDLPLETRCARFTIEPGVFEKLPGLHVVTALVLNAPNLDAEGWIKGHFDSVCKMVAGKKLEAKRGRLDVWKRYTSELKDRGSDNLFLTKGARREPTKGKSFSVNPLVDFYNTLSVKHVVTGGGFDLEAMPGDLRLRLSKKGDSFLALDSQGGRPVEVEPGEVNYIAEGADTETTGNVVTRHLAYKQSRLGLIQEGSKHVFLMFEMPPDLVDDVAPELIQDLRRLPGLYSEGHGASVHIQRADPEPSSLKLVVLQLRKETARDCA
ncbi:unnamed protein product [Symbiodinium natans]|uniref:B3/B4 tRNA-binding domain-containing protein n=1 Tax=Symbiodinium natans TaxID=878477 RepID=A0A812V9P9_9DINO|nr:unnamed protein product [Symbiodinium natans]